MIKVTRKKGESIIEFTNRIKTEIHKDNIKNRNKYHEQRKPKA